MKINQNNNKNRIQQVYFKNQALKFLKMIIKNCLIIRSFINIKSNQINRYLKHKLMIILNALMIIILKAVLKSKHLRM
jgi:hypothetical protein